MYTKTTLCYNSRMKWAIILLCACCFIFAIPRIIIGITNTTYILNDVDVDLNYIVILGAHVDDSDQPTELLKERLDAGLQVIQKSPNAIPVVSNTRDAALIMKQYLVDHGINPDDIIVDEDAYVTTDSCNTEEHEEYIGQNIVLVSQRYHLPRTLYQCNKYDAQFYGYPAELSNSIDRSATSWWVKMTVRTFRYLRESGLILLAIVGVYR